MGTEGGKKKKERLDTKSRGSGGCSKQNCEEKMEENETAKYKERKNKSKEEE